MTGTNPYTWVRHRPVNDCTRADIHRGDIWVAEITLAGCLPFHADHLNRICAALRQAEQDAQEEP